jgi:hypothetical protein
MLNNFFLISYPAGAAGRFLCSIIMASETVAHFDQNIENNKTLDKCLDYIKTRFTNDLNNWLPLEPKHNDAWNLHFVSATYPRGEELSVEQFQQLCLKYGTPHFIQTVNENKLILFPWNKVTNPAFFTEAKKLTVLLDKQSHGWFDQALWKKHYGIEDGKVLLRTHDYRSNPHMIEYFKKFNNPLYASEPVEDFYQTHIINNPDKNLFKSKTQFSGRKNNICIGLSDILNREAFVKTIETICLTHALKPINKEFIIAGHQHWISCHDF